MRKIIFAAAVAAALVISAPLAASANDEVVDPATAPAQTTDYTPDDPTTPSLAGSAAIGECARDVPWINYSVQLNDPDSISTSNTAVLVLTNGTDSVEIALGELVDNSLSGRVLWPGASVDGNGVANGWPGWTQNSSGAWVETNGNYAWTRGAFTASIKVNPELAVSLSYPQTTPECLAGPRSGSGSAVTSLPLTGSDAAVLPLTLVGGAIVLAGVGALVLQRRRRSRV